MILTKEFLEKINACEEGIQACIDGNYIGMDYSDAINAFISNGKEDFAEWLIELKTTEQYVRDNGSVFTMGAYQVFNPLTGQHTKYQTEENAKTAIVDIAKEIIKIHIPTACQELANENGDTTWIPVPLIESINISI